MLRDTLFLIGTAIVVCGFAGQLPASARAAAPDGLDEVTIPPAPHVRPNAQSVAFSRDGKLVAAGYGGGSNGRFPLKPTGGGVVVWEAATGTPVQRIGQFGDIVRISFTHDDTSLLYSRVYTPGDSVAFDQIRLVKFKPGELLQKWDGYTCAASPVEGRIAIQLGRGNCRAYQLDNVKKDGAAEIAFDNGRDAECLTYSDDGKLLATVHRVLEPISRQDGTINPKARAIRLKGLTVFDAKTLVPLRSAKHDGLADCNALAISNQGTLLTTGHKQGVVRVFDGNTLEELRMLKVAAKGCAFPAYSPDGKELAVLTQPANSPTWRYAATPSGFEIGREHHGTTCEVTFYDTATFEPLRRFRFQDGTFRTWHANQHRASLNPQRLAWSPDGKRLLIGANGVMLFEAQTGRVVRHFDLK